jgi:hypothetical protein
MGVLDELDLTLKLSQEEEADRLDRTWTRLTQLRLTLGGLIGSGELGPPVCVVFEGWDASGKGGAIKRLVAQLDPRHVRVVQFAAPTHDETRHHFLWRFWPSLPGWGGMAVFDRSWYGRVLVERVEGYAAREQWQRAYDEIRGFERTLADEGMVLIKFWLHISPEEQLKRFEKREKHPHRRRLAQSGEVGRVQAGGRGHGRPDQPRAARAVAPDPCRVEALRASGRDRDRDLGDRGGHASAGDGAAGAHHITDSGGGMAEPQALNPEPEAVSRVPVGASAGRPRR